jgi:phosphatidylserine decarboxylase
MIRIHREGWTTIFITLALFFVINAVVFNASSILLLNLTVLLFTLVFLIIIVRFFRNPVREVNENPRHIIAPADGKVVVIEETEEPEYFKDKRIQISIFMSPFNVHVNRFPAGGTVEYCKYHAGKYLMAFNPKSSTENERTSIVVKVSDNSPLGDTGAGGAKILFRQIAGTLARRIVCYCKEGDVAEQGKEMGFIKFGSRVDVFLPLGTKVNVQLNDIVFGAKTIIAEIK